MVNGRGWGRGGGEEEAGGEEEGGREKEVRWRRRKNKKLEGRGEEQDVEEKSKGAEK